MSRAWSRRRAALFAGPEAEAPPAARPARPGRTRPARGPKARPARAKDAGAPRRGGEDAVLVGRDFGRPRRTARRASRSRSGWLPVLAACLVAALGLAALRVHVLRLRYELGEIVREETQLLERQRAATVAVRELRDPRRLRRLADELGLGPPERVITLPASGAAPTRAKASP